MKSTSSEVLNASGSNLAGMTTPGSLPARSQRETYHRPTREDAWERAIPASPLKMKMGTHMIWLGDDITSITFTFKPKLENFKRPKHQEMIPVVCSHLFLTFPVATNLLQVCHAASPPVPLKFNFLGFALKRVHCQIVFIQCENLIASLIRDRAQRAAQQK